MHSHVTCIRTTCVQTTSERDVNFKTQPITQPGRGCAATAMTTATTTTAAAASWLGLAGLGLAGGTRWPAAGGTRPGDLQPQVFKKSCKNPLEIPKGIPR